MNDKPLLPLLPLLSISGQRMLGYLPPYYGASRVMRAIMQSHGCEIDELRTVLDSVLDQMYVEAATWGLSIWERELKIRCHSGDSVEPRRARIISKLMAPPTITPKIMKKIINMFVPNRTAELEFIWLQYAFRAHIPLDEIRFLFELYETVDELKPAHLQFSPMSRWRDVLAYVVPLLRPQIAMYPELGSLWICGFWPYWDSLGTANKKAVRANQQPVTGIYVFPHIGVSKGVLNKLTITLLCKRGVTGVWVYPRAGILLGTVPEASIAGHGSGNSIVPGIGLASGVYAFPRCGNFNAGMSVDGQEVA